MAVEHNYKILLISTEIGDMELDKAYGVSENAAMKFLGLKEAKFNSGIEGVMKLANSGRLTPQLIGNFTKIVLKNRLEVISGKKETGEEENEKFDANDYPVWPIWPLLLLFQKVIIDIYIPFLSRAFIVFFASCSLISFPNKEETEEYDVILMNIDSPNTLESMKAEQNDINCFVTAMDLYSIFFIVFSPYFYFVVVVVCFVSSSFI